MNTQDEADKIRAQVTKQGDVVKQLKKDGANTEIINEAVNLLKELKIKLKQVEDLLDPCHDFDKEQFDSHMTRKMFFIPSFEIYGGVSGLYDFGPTGCAIKQNIINRWKELFVVGENILEMDCTNLTPYKVLKTSGHVDRFSDFMVKDSVTGECYRADKIIEDHVKNLLKVETNESIRHEYESVLLQAGSYNQEQLSSAIKKYNILSPGNNNPFTDPFPFNLMFDTHIGPEGTNIGYLRPETAQGLFVNFRRLYEYNNKKLPFGAGQVGIGFRNEISPRGGLLRVREFSMAEIEYFVNPENKNHENFHLYSNEKLPLFPRENQMGDGKVLTMSLKDAIDNKIIGNETLAYFLYKTYLYTISIGIKSDRIRFRQHLMTEMAHYASDCWDCEILTSFGWIECVGHADRSCYDLERHMNESKQDMYASEKYEIPKEINIMKPDFNNQVIGKVFKKDQKTVKDMLTDLGENNPDKCSEYDCQLKTNGSFTMNGFEITKDMIKFVPTAKKVHEYKFIPHVIEPSYGIGRLLYCVLEHNFSTRPQDKQRIVLSFNPSIAPIKCYILPLNGSDNSLMEICNDIRTRLLLVNILNKIDGSAASIGKRYSRADELGVPFNITVDFESVNDKKVTIRNRDNMHQARIPISEVTDILHDLILERKTWDNYVAKNYDVITNVNEE